MTTPSRQELDADRETSPVDELVRALASQPLRTSPQEAARRVVERIDGEPRSRIGWRWAAVAASLAVAVVVGLVVERRQTPQTPATSLPIAPAPVATLDAPPPLPDNVVQFWLDSETPVYFIVGPAGDAPGGTP